MLYTWIMETTTPIKNDFEYASHIQYDYKARLERNKLIISAPPIQTPPADIESVIVPPVAPRKVYYSSLSRKLEAKRIAEEKLQASLRAKWGSL